MIVRLSRVRVAAATDGKSNGREPSEMEEGRAGACRPETGSSDEKRIEEEDVMFRTRDVSRWML